MAKNGLESSDSTLWVSRCAYDSPDFWNWGMCEDKVLRSSVIEASTYSRIKILSPANRRRKMDSGEKWNFHSNANTLLPGDSNATTNNQNKTPLETVKNQKLQKTLWSAHEIRILSKIIKKMRYQMSWDATLLLKIKALQRQHNYSTNHPTHIRPYNTTPVHTSLQRHGDWYVMFRIQKYFNSRIYYMAEMGSNELETEKSMTRPCNHQQITIHRNSPALGRYSIHSTSALLNHPNSKEQELICYAATVQQLRSVRSGFILRDGETILLL